MLERYEENFDEEEFIISFMAARNIRTKKSGNGRDKGAERRFRSPAKAYAKCQTMLELRHIMQVADRIDDEDRRVIHGMAAKY